MDIGQFKRGQLEQVAAYRDELRVRPDLRWLFFELTNRCNLSCAHCGSSCSSQGNSLVVGDIRKVLTSVIDAGETPMIALTGGEPLMHPDFETIASVIRDMGFLWGMTTNATLIDAKTADMLKRTGMGTVSVSLDGLEAEHDALRRKKGAWQAAVRGLHELQKAGFDPQVTTVFHNGNFDQLDQTYEFLKSEGIKHWRPINVEPIGRACESKQMLLTSEQFRKLIAFIRGKRFDHDNEMEVCFGCSHYLGVMDERMVRDHYFLCGAGIRVASIRSNGDITACLDIENRPELVQGNIASDDFMDVWYGRFQAFRRDRTAKSKSCAACPDRAVCGGDSFHTWDFDHNEPLLCGLKMMRSEP